MGCDIHLHTEVKLNGRWEHYSTPLIKRDYELFAKMAGVRGEETPISKAKGLPDDMNYLTNFDAIRCDGYAHSHSWLNAEEIAALIYWIEESRKIVGWDFANEYFGYLFGSGWQDFNNFPADRPEGLEDIRFVFWFNS